MSLDPRVRLGTKLRNLNTNSIFTVSLITEKQVRFSCISSYRGTTLEVNWSIKGVNRHLGASLQLISQGALLTFKRPASV